MRRELTVRLRRAQPRWVAARGLLLCSLCLFLSGGCSRQGPVERTQAQAPTPGGVPLRQAYAELLVAPVWAPVEIEPNRYVRVAGKLRRAAGPEMTVEVYYTRDAVPPRVAFFKVNARQYSSAEFGAFCRWAVLSQELEASATAAPAADTPPEK